METYYLFPDRRRIFRMHQESLYSNRSTIQQQLYSSRSIHKESDNLRFFPDDNFVRLDEVSKTSCEGLLNVNECLNALKTMEANKSPGSDGFSAEFYKVLWSDIAPFLVNAINCSFQKGLLSVTQR